MKNRCDEFFFGAKIKANNIRVKSKKEKQKKQKKNTLDLQIEDWSLVVFAVLRWYFYLWGRGGYFYLTDKNAQLKKNPNAKIDQENKVGKNEEKDTYLIFENAMMKSIKVQKWGKHTKV